MNENEYTPIINGTGGSFLAFVTKRIEPDMEVFEQTKENLIEESQTKAENTHINEWYMNLRESANIEDNRSDYYSL